MVLRVLPPKVSAPAQYGSEYSGGGPCGGANGQFVWWRSWQEVRLNDAPPLPCSSSRVHLKSLITGIEICRQRLPSRAGVVCVVCVHCVGVPHKISDKPYQAGCFYVNARRTTNHTRHAKYRTIWFSTRSVRIVLPTAMAEARPSLSMDTSWSLFTSEY